jgi:hypothetical protein
MGHKGSLPCSQKHTIWPYLLVHALPPHLLKSQFLKYSRNKINKCTNVKIIFLTHNLSVWHRHTPIILPSSSSATLLIQFNTLKIYALLRISMNTITNILVEWTKCFSQDLYNTVCPLWHWCSHNPTKSNCEYYYQTFLSYTTHSRHNGQRTIWLYVLTWWWQSCAKRSSNIRLQWILLYSAKIYIQPY